MPMMVPIARTARSVSPISLPEVASSFAIILILYSVVFGFGIRYLLSMMKQPPVEGEQPPIDDAPLRSFGRHGLAHNIENKQSTIGME